VKEHFVFRPGELHIVFDFLHAMGKYIECSGLAQILIKAGIYGPTTMDQILRGKLNYLFIFKINQLKQFYVYILSPMTETISIAEANRRR
jgi:hypothetical protein